MSDDLVKRLRRLDTCIFPVERDRCACGEAADYIQQLEAALRNIAKGDIPRTVKIPFYDDGKSSKHDRCDHARWFYEECGDCIEDYARAAVEGNKDE